ncbi:MAG: DEAD/DEAH box helicase [Sandaracinaceae bacterium]
MTSAAPAPATFESLGLSELVLKAIGEMGFTHPTPVQAAAFAPAREGIDLIVQARTGTGKTVAFGLPLVEGLVDPDGGPQALILAPTRELALQSSREIAKLGKHLAIRTSAVYGGAPIERQVKELREGAQIVSGTPGRVLDHLRRGTLDGSRLKILILDEADEMLSMGFAKELNAIVALLPESRQTMLFSATIDGAVERIANRIMTDPTHIGLSSDAVGAKTISHFYYLCGRGKSRDLLRVLETEDPESALIFCNTKVETERVATALEHAGFNARYLSGDLPQSEREKVLAQTRQGTLRYLVATDVAARGIDISHVTHVINYDFPENIEVYIHRTGRTGRAGRTGTAISLIEPAALGSLYYLRLQYKIHPIERTLPSEGEMRSRQELDRIDLLRDAFPQPPTQLDRSVARRLMTDPDAERLLAGLLSAFFGTKDDVDEVAAASRRERAIAPRDVILVDDDGETPEPVSLPYEEPAEADADDDFEDRRTERPPPPAPETSPEPEPETSPEPEPDARDARRQDDRGPEPGAEFENEDDVYLYVNLGRRDGVRPGEIVRLLVTEADVEREDVGRIRIRDRHSFVGVPADLADEIIEALGGKQSHDKELVVERARDQG